MARHKTLTVVLLVLIGLLLSLPVVAAPVVTDISEHWAKAQIERWVDDGLIAGYPDGSFKPDQGVTRAEFVALVNRAFENQSGKAACNFTDINPADWFYRDVASAKAAGYISGYPDGSFKPAGHVTRQEAAVMLAKALGLAPGETAGAKSFSDCGSISPWAGEGVEAILAARIMSGFPDKTFGPQKAITRAETVVTLAQALAYIEDSMPVIKGTVKMGRDPQKGAVVRIFAKGSPVVLKETTTDGDGFFAFEVDKGDYDLTAVWDKNVGYLSGVAAGKAEAGREILLTEGVRVSGTIADGSGKRLANLPLVFTANPSFVGRTDDHGEFSVMLVPRANDGRLLTYKGSYQSNSTEQVFVASRQFSADTNLGLLQLTSGSTSGGGGGSSSGGLPADTTPPAWAAGFPNIASIAADGFKVKLKADENGTAYFVLPAQDAPAPTAAEVKNGTGSGGAAARKSGSTALQANTETSINIGGLTADTSYDIYLVAEDAANNLQPSPAKLTIKTAPAVGPGDVITPPGYGTPPELQTAGIDSVTLTLFYNKYLDTSSVPANDDFTVSVNGSPRAITHPGITGSNVLLALETPAQAGDSVRVSYTPGDNPLRDREGNAAAAFSDVAATNTTETLQAPEPDRTVATSFAASTAFLYTGSSPVQTGVASDTIEPEKAAVLRGKVLTRDGLPLSGVQVNILGRPEFGSTRTRADGMFDLATNGGTSIAINYIKDGCLTVQRHLDVPLQDYVWLPDVTMIECDPKVNTVRLDGSPEMQVAQGSPVMDADGARQATLLFPGGTTAEMVFPDGSTRALSSFNVRLTEYTVGDNGPEAMPGELPEPVGYTYALEYTVDEAVAAGAGSVRFDRPIYHYNENFLGFPIGGTVPVGYYDRDRGEWIPAENGRVIKLLSISEEGLAALDLDGSGTPAGAAALAGLGIDQAELLKLAGLYKPGQGFWRVPLSHFTSYDYNWPISPPDDAEPPKVEPPKEPPEEDDPCTGAGSIIEYQNQVLGETARVFGTPFTLNYRSSRVAGNKNQLEIQLSGDSLPASLKSIELEITWMGKRYTMNFPQPGPNSWHKFLLDQTDAYGRQLQGGQVAGIKIGYTYDGVYLEPSAAPNSFGQPGGVPLSVSRDEITLWKSFKVPVASWDAQPLGLGGWTLDVHQAYDPTTKTLYQGDGSFRKLSGLLPGQSGNSGGAQTGEALGGGVISTVEHNLIHITVFDVAVAPDHSLYIAALENIYRIKDGTATIAAGLPLAGPVGSGAGGDGGPATETRIHGASHIVSGPDGSFYFNEVNNWVVRKVDKEGIITTVAGIGVELHNPLEFIGDVGEKGSSGLATEAIVVAPRGLALGPDGSLYIADSGHHLVRRVDPAGYITTVAGKRGYEGLDPGDDEIGIPALEAQLDMPSYLALGPDGSLYIAEESRVYKVDPQGIITVIAGGEISGFSGDGGPALAATFDMIMGLAVGPDGSLYISDGNRIRRIGLDGIINTVVGTGEEGYSGDGGAPLQAQLWMPAGMDFGPDGSLYIADMGNLCVRKVSSSAPGMALTDIMIPSKDGRQVYLFDGGGRHLRTVHPLTGKTVYSFAYDAGGRLQSVTDGGGNVTEVQRDAAGAPTAVVAPGGQRTGLEVNNKGYLSALICPLGYEKRFEYAGDADQEHSILDGLLTGFTDHEGNVYSFAYDENNRLIHDRDPAGGSTSLSRIKLDDGYRVEVSDALGRLTTYLMQRPAGGELKMSKTYPDGSGIITEFQADGGWTVDHPDGTRVDLKKSGDPRWGQMASGEITTITTPDGLTASVSKTSSVELATPGDPFSLTSLTDTLTINGNTWQTSYNAADRTMTYATPEGRETVQTIDDLGRIIRSGESGLLPEEYTYDAAGRLVRFQQGDRLWQLEYDERGNLIHTIDPLGQVAAYEYNEADLRLKESQPGGREILYSYDKNGNPISITPPGREAHTFDYTPVNLEKSYTSPTGTGQTITYNAARQVTRFTAGGQTAGYGYDEAGRLTDLTFPGETVNYTYDQCGRLEGITATGGGINESRTFDGFLLTGVAVDGNVSGTLGFSYNSDFTQNSLEVNGTGIDYKYDKDSLLTGAGDLNVTRNAESGAVQGTTLGGVTTMYTYNDYGELTGFEAWFGSDLLYAQQLAYDTLGRVSEKRETLAGGETGTGETHLYTYSYDVTGRLASVNCDGALIACYNYDPNGNRISGSDGDGSFVAAYDGEDRLTRCGDTEYSYQADGSLQSQTEDNGNTAAYSYDVLGGLRQVLLPDGTQLEYLLDGNNRRAGKKVNGLQVQGFLYQDALRLAAELDGSNNLVSRFIYGIGNNVPDYLQKNGRTYRIISDYLGSPRLIVDSVSGEVAQRLDYDAFGRVVLDSNPGFQPFGFAGGIYDCDTGLTRFGARDYDAKTGRWTAKDPIGFRAEGTNLYAYVHNDPLNWIDPTGLDSRQKQSFGEKFINFLLTFAEGCGGYAPGDGARYALEKIKDQEAAKQAAQAKQAQPAKDPQQSETNTQTKSPAKAPK